MIAGGEHVTAVTDFVFADSPAIDYCALGEGEETLVELADHLASGGGPQAIAGLAFRDGNAIRYNAPRKRIREVDTIPRPAWDLVPIEEYLSHGVMTGVDLGRSMPMIASRGCPYECTFCSNPVMWGRLWSTRPPASVVAEMTQYIGEYRAANFDFYDLTAIVRKDWIVEFAQLLIDRDLNITWQLPSGTRSEAIDSEVTGLLYESGCRHLNYAPESGSIEVLRSTRKKYRKIACSIRCARLSPTD